MYCYIYYYYIYIFIIFYLLTLEFEFDPSRLEITIFEIIVLYHMLAFWCNTKLRRRKFLISCLIIPNISLLQARSSLLLYVLLLYCCSLLLYCCFSSLLYFFIGPKCYDLDEWWVLCNLELAGLKPIQWCSLACKLVDHWRHSCCLLWW